MDPITAIGLLASVLRLTQTTKDIISDMRHDYDAVKEAPKLSKQLRQEMETMSDLSDELENLLRSALQDAPFPATSLLALMVVFRELVEKMKSRVAVSKTEGIFKRLKRPFSLDENERMLKNCHNSK